MSGRAYCWASIGVLVCAAAAWAFPSPEPTPATPPPGSAPVFADDFESGVLDAADGGVWAEVSATTPAGSIGEVSVAAHRGDAGLRAVLAVPSSSSKFFVRFTDAGIWDGGYFVRGWIRLPSVQAAGVISVLQIEELGQQPFFAVHVSAASGSDAGVLQAVGGNGNSFQRDDAGVFDLSTWHLLEAYAQDVGTPAGSRALFVDGALLSHAVNQDWTGGFINAITIGEPFLADGGFIGKVDFDDVRGGPTRPASTFRFSNAPGSATVGQCASFSVALYDSTGVPAQPDYPVVLTLSVSGVDGGFFSDSTCTTAAVAPTIPPITFGYVGYFSPSDPGTASLHVSHPDFLGPATTTFQVAPASEDSGFPTDAGVIDAGGTDAGVLDAGSAIDAGSVVDGGSGENDGGPGALDGGAAFEANLGCGCGAGTPTAAFLWAGLIALALTRRRPTR